MKPKELRYKSAKYLYRKLKSFIGIVLGRDIFIRRDVRFPWEYLGSDYGGWRISLEKLNDSSIIYSFGIGNDITFDIELIKRLKVRVHAFDPTPECLEWLKNHNIPDEFQVYGFGLASFDGTASFYKPRKSHHVSHSVVHGNSENRDSINLKVKRLCTIMDELGHDRIDLLKMDIEGSEYDVIKDFLSTSIRPKQLLIEFHHRNHEIGIEKTKEALTALRSEGYKVFALSPTHQEISFVLDDEN